MKRLRLASMVILLLSLAVFIVWRFFIPFLDWAVVLNGVLMLVCIFTTVFSTVRIRMSNK